MLVAWRVKEWVEPILYRVIFLVPEFDGPGPSAALAGFPVMTRISVDSLLSQKASRDPGFFRRTTRHLYITGGYEMDEAPLLEALSGITNLFLQGMPTGNNKIRPTFDGLERLQRLTIPINAFFGKDPMDFTRPLFRNITHLELFDKFHDDSLLTFDRIPNLTHLSFNFEISTRPQARLCSDTTLLCIVSFHPNESFGIQLLADDRFVCIHQVIDFRLDWLCAGGPRLLGHCRCVYRCQTGGQGRPLPILYFRYRGPVGK
ncbi:hypothetical protein B0H16DRAFT_651100 [Mycena metata]|uniref:Uncharacterized protein n=1 Tax=Mycena metata TaxID=1033252 RepID=A0AAD7J8I0_9AGAR|nr:hypothetical protein B0H16DRAFT_651100 [Mycena metata]